MRYQGGVFVRRRPDPAALAAYGFQETDGVLRRSTDLLDHAFTLTVDIAQDVCYTVVDNASGEEYALAYVQNAVGGFVGQVRDACEAVLEEIAAQCFVPEVFHSPGAKAVIRYIKETYEAEPEFLWEKFPDNAVFREMESGKWYAALLTVQRQKLGLEGDGTVEILDLRSRDISRLVDGTRFLPGYHMNKTYWFTVLLDGRVPEEEVFRLIDESRQTLPRKRPRKP